MSQALEFAPITLPEAAAPSSETANQITHGLGFCLSVLAACVLMSAVVPTGDPYRIAGCIVYALTLVALYAASTLSHSFEDAERREFYRMLDQVCIFLLVVGTYTPFGLVHARQNGWQVILIGMWLYALAGIFLRVRRPSETLRPLIFLVMAWLPAPILYRAFQVSSTPGLLTILGGGLAYSAGVWFLINDHRHRYFHAVWHTFTILGSALHFLFVLEYVVPVGA